MKNITNYNIKDFLFDNSQIIKRLISNINSTNNFEEIAVFLLETIDFLYQNVLTKFPGIDSINEQIFLGNGLHSVIKQFILFGKLRQCVFCLGGIQQSYMEEAENFKEFEKIKNNLREICVGLGVDTKTL